MNAEAQSVWALALAFVPAWTVFAANVLSPGPNVFNTIATAMGSGRGAGLGAAAAVALGVAIWAGGVLGGGAALFQAYPAAELVLTALGAGLLALFGLRYLRRSRAEWRARAAAGGAAGLAVAPRAGVSVRRAFVEALAVQLTNPKALTTWIVLLGIVPASDPGALAVFGLGAVAIAGSVHCAYALLFSSAPVARAYARAAWIIFACAGLFFLAVSVSLWTALAAAVRAGALS